MLSLLSIIVKSWCSAVNRLWQLSVGAWTYLLEKMAGTVHDDNDRSYADALLDLQLRLFLRSEYGRAKPPSNIFQKVLWAIERHQQQSASRRVQVRVPQFFARLGRTVRGAIASATVERMLPAGVSLLLVISIFGNNIQQLLGVDEDLVVGNGLSGLVTPLDTSNVDSIVAPSSSANLPGASVSHPPARQSFDNSTGSSARFKHTSANLPDASIEDVAADDASVTLEEAQVFRMLATGKYAGVPGLDGGLQEYLTPRYGPQ